MGTDRSTDGARENVGLGQRGAVTYSGRLRSSRLILIAAAITVVALSLFVWQQSTSMRPALAGGLGDATGEVIIQPTDANADIADVVVGDRILGIRGGIIDLDGVANIGATFALQWYSGGVAVEGEINQDFTVLAKDIGKQIHVVGSFIDDGGNPEEVRSASTRAIPNAVSRAATGTISFGKDESTPLEVHDAIRGEHDIADEDGLPVFHDYEWQWLRNGQPIPDANDFMRYDIRGDDVGARLSLRLRFTDKFGFDEEFLSEASDPIVNGPEIVATNGFYFDDDVTTVETLTVDLSGLNYPDMPANRSYEYDWSYVDADLDYPRRMQIPFNSTGDTYTITDADDGKYIFVSVTIFDADTNDFWGFKLANEATPKITMRPTIPPPPPPPVIIMRAPANLAANVASGGGSVTITWGLTSGDTRPTSFQYRYRATVLLSDSPFTDADWFPLQGATRRVTVSGEELINNAAYTFELRSSNAGDMIDPLTVEATYLHKTKACS